MQNPVTPAYCRITRLSSILIQSSELAKPINFSHTLAIQGRIDLRKNQTN
jgi:hypothetical protein